MQIAFFLIPKAETAYLQDSYTMRQALEKMEYHGYTAVPVLDKEGRYKYTITVADFLWKMKNTQGLKFADTENIPLSDVKIGTVVEAVNIDAKVEDLVVKATEQNFIPVVDDYGTYIGMVRRREIIEYCLPYFLKSAENKKTEAPQSAKQEVATN